MQKKYNLPNRKSDFKFNLFREFFMDGWQNLEKNKTI